MTDTKAKRRHPKYKGIHKVERRKEYILNRYIEAGPEGIEVTQLAEELGVTRRTVFNDLKDKDLKDRLISAFQEQLGIVAISKAWGVYISGLDSKDPWLRNKVAEKVLTVAGIFGGSDVRDSDDIQEWLITGKQGGNGHDPGKSAELARKTARESA